MSGGQPGPRLRVVVFTTLPLAAWLVNAWATREGHAIALVVTTPGPAGRRGVAYRDVIALVPPEQDVVVTTRLRRILPHLRALAPDLLLCFSFPFRLPATITAVPRLGAYNLHPTPLPAYRGPNPQRMLYDGATTVGATLHRIEEEIDSGPILSRHEAPIAPDATGEQITQAWVETMAAALTEGLSRALAGEAGEEQDPALASYATRFAAEELWLDWHLPATVVQRRAIALNIFGVQARALIAEQPYAVIDAVAVPGSPSAGAPGTILAHSSYTLLVQAADGAVRVRVGALAAPPQGG